MKSPGMNRSSASFLQAVVVLIGLGVLALMLWEPHLEGRNAHATTFEIYFKDPFLAYVYVGSIPFFVALYQAFRVLGAVKREGTFSAATLRALRIVKRCALTIVGFVVGALAIILAFGDGEDRPGGVFMCGLAILAASAIATTAALLARSLLGALNRAEGRPA